MSGTFVSTAAAVTAGNAFGNTLQTASTALRTTMLALSESVRSAENSAQLGYKMASAGYLNGVDTTIENALSSFNMTSISADQQRATDSNSKMGTAMQGLVSAEGGAQISRIGATKEWSHGIADAYQAGARGGVFFTIHAGPYGGGNPVAGLTYRNLPISCGVYPKKGKRDLAMHILPGTERFLFGLQGGLNEVLYDGTGFLYVRRVEARSPLGR